jgi:hypothetical protein
MAVELETLIKQAMTLSPIDKVRLLEQVAATLERDLEQQGAKPLRSLYGLWADIDISADEIDEARREMWANFLREDI